jgi:hypothetical protein
MVAIRSLARLIALTSLGTALAANAAIVTAYTDSSAWSAAAGAPVLTQDFSGYASGTAMSGVEFMPGVSATTNMATLNVSFAGNVLFGTGGGVRLTGTAYYEITLALPYSAAALDIASFEAVPGDSSTAVGPGTLTAFFGDGTQASFLIDGTADPTFPNIFFGIVSDTPITRLRWAEALEGSGFNEETALDNFRLVATAAVPEPPSLPMVAALLGALMLQRRRSLSNRAAR